MDFNKFMVLALLVVVRGVRRGMLLSNGAIVTTDVGGAQRSYTFKQLGSIAEEKNATTNTSWSDFLGGNATPPMMKTGPALLRQESVSTNIAKFMGDRLATDLKASGTGLERFQSLAGLGPHLPIEITFRTFEQMLPRNRKVAFLFLLMDGVDHESIWDAFFHEATQSDFGNSFSIYTHRATPTVFELPFERWNAIRVPHVETGWCALSGVEVAIFAEALIDPSNVQFVLLSQNTIPLKPFSYVVSHLMRTSSSSKICYASQAHNQNPWIEILENERIGGCHFKDHWTPENPNVRKHHQWLILSREHAFAFVKRARLALNVFQMAWQDTAARGDGTWWDGCSDEAVVSLALLLEKAEGNINHVPEVSVDEDLRSIGVEQSCLTWVRWRQCFRGSRLEITETLQGDIVKLYQSGALWHLPSMLTPNKTGGSEWSKRSSIALNGFPHFFGPPAEPPTVKLSYLAQLVTEEGFMFGRKFNLGVEVEQDISFQTLKPPETDFVAPHLDLHIALLALWKRVKPTAPSNVWSRNEFSGEPSQ